MTEHCIEQDGSATITTKRFKRDSENRPLVRDNMITEDALPLPADITPDLEECESEEEEGYEG